MRCAPAAVSLALAIVKMGRISETGETDLTRRLRAIPGVSQVRFDPPRSTIHILYDGELGTAETVYHFLAAAEREDEGHEQREGAGHGKSRRVA